MFNTNGENTKEILEGLQNPSLPIIMSKQEQTIWDIIYRIEQGQDLGLLLDTDYSYKTEDEIFMSGIVKGLKLAIEVMKTE